jgi:hypothetical protein
MWINPVLPISLWITMVSGLFRVSLERMTQALISVAINTSVMTADIMGVEGIEIPFVQVLSMTISQPEVVFSVWVSMECLGVSHTSVLLNSIFFVFNELMVVAYIRNSEIPSWSYKLFGIRVYPEFEFSLWITVESRK